MKRLFFLLFLSAFIGMSCHAQIQNKIYDFVLGQTTKQEVKNYFNSKPEIEWEEDKTDESILVEGLRFGGCYWDAVFFSFYKDVLLDVHFSAMDTEKVSKADIKRNWEKLKQSLKKKYGSYFQEKFSTDEHLVFIDDIIMLDLQIENKNGRKLLSLSYIDIKLNLAQQKGDADEL